MLFLPFMQMYTSEEPETDELLSLDNTEERY